MGVSRKLRHHYFSDCQSILTNDPYKWRHHLFYSPCSWLQPEYLSRNLLGWHEGTLGICSKDSERWRSRVSHPVPFLVFSNNCQVQFHPSYPQQKHDRPHLHNQHPPPQRHLRRSPRLSPPAPRGTQPTRHPGAHPKHKAYLARQPLHIIATPSRSPRSQNTIHTPRARRHRRPHPHRLPPLPPHPLHIQFLARRAKQRHPHYD